MIEFHVTLGMWVRSTWIYGNEEERERTQGTGT